MSLHPIRAIPCPSKVSHLSEERPHLSTEESHLSAEGSWEQGERRHGSAALGKGEDAGDAALRQTELQHLARLAGRVKHLTVAARGNVSMANVTS